MATRSGAVHHRWLIVLRGWIRTARHWTTWHGWWPACHGWRTEWHRWWTIWHWRLSIHWGNRSILHCICRIWHQWHSALRWHLHGWSAIHYRLVLHWGVSISHGCCRIEHGRTIIAHQLHFWGWLVHDCGVSWTLSFNVLGRIC